MTDRRVERRSVLKQKTPHAFDFFSFILFFFFKTTNQSFDFFFFFSFFFLYPNNLSSIIRPHLQLCCTRVLLFLLICLSRPFLFVICPCRCPVHFYVVFSSSICCPCLLFVFVFFPVLMFLPSFFSSIWMVLISDKVMITIAISIAYKQ